MTQLLMRWTSLAVVLSVGSWLGCGADAVDHVPGADAGSDTTALAPCRAPSTATALVSTFITGAAISGDQILFVDDALEAIPFSGGTMQTIATGGEDMRGLTVVGDAAYFTSEHPVGDPDPNGKQSSDQALYAASISTGDVTMVADSFSSSASLSDDTSAYFAGVGFGSVLEFTPPSTTPTMIDAGKLETNAFAARNDDLYVAGIDYGAGNGMAGLIVRVSKNGGAATMLLHLVGLPLDVAVDDHSIYWIEEAPYGTFGTGRIARADLDGKNEKTLAMVSAAELVLDHDSVYFLSDSLNRIPKAGGAIEVVASGLEGAAFLQISGSDAIWINLENRALSETRPMTLTTMCLHAAP
ncbi:MAG TPA: hypothetical protein VHZ95_03860 [Polyangiales bacterium]|nr:hypothetical protein [Polyangiales bacterium]